MTNVSHRRWDPNDALFFKNTPADVATEALMANRVRSIGLCQA
jgi:hypothetical protein